MFEVLNADFGLGTMVAKWILKSARLRPEGPSVASVSGRRVGAPESEGQA